MKVGLNPGKVVLRWSKWVKVGLNPGKVVLRWCKSVKVDFLNRFWELKISR